MKASVAKRLRAKLKYNAKVKSVDVSADDSPWDEDDSVEAITKQAKKLNVKPTSVRSYGDPEGDEIFSEDSVKYEKGLNKVAKRVANKANVYNSPATQEIVTRLALASVLRQLPEAERNYASSKAERAAYAYSNLINQARELMADLRNMSSTDALADRVIAEAVNPAFMQLVQFVISEVSTIRSKLSGGSNIESLRRLVNEQLTGMLEGISGYGQETLDKATESTRKSLKG